jgi:hypothetical protein
MSISWMADRDLSVPVSFCLNAAVPPSRLAFRCISEGDRHRKVFSELPSPQRTAVYALARGFADGHPYGQV